MVDDTLYCMNHPKRETALRCSKCDRPICPECMIQTPVGGRCRECANLRRAPVYTVGARHYLRALAAGLLTALVLGALLGSLARGLFFALWLGAFYGWAIAQAMERAAGYKRGFGLQATASVCIVVGALFGQVATLLIAGVPADRALLLLVGVLQGGLGVGLFVLVAILIAVGNLR